MGKMGPDVPCVTWGVVAEAVPAGVSRSRSWELLPNNFVDGSPIAEVFVKNPEAAKTTSVARFVFA